MDYQSGYAHYLTEEKRASSNTQSSYLRDVNQYLHWLAGEELPPGWVWADREELRGRYALPSAFQSFSKLVADRLGHF